MSTKRQVLMMASAILCQSIAFSCVATDVSYAQIKPQASVERVDATEDAEPPLTQIPLAAKQVEALLAALAEMSAMLAKLPDDQADELDPKTEAALDKAAKRYGFKDFADYESVGDNVLMILDGFDPDSKTYVSKDVLLKAEREEVKTDTTLRPSERKAALKEIDDLLAKVEPVQYPDNIAVVRSYYDRLIAAFPSDS